MKKILMTMTLFTMTLLAANAEDAAKSVLRRLIPDQADNFQFETIPANNGKDVFEIEGTHGKITIRGNNTISKTSGFHWYLKHVAKCHVSWDGDQLNLPATLPSPSEKIRKTSLTKYGFYFNYCTFNYTMAWWDWARWEREIDYMALCGINMPLAIVGSEALWLNFLKRFGYSTAEAKKFIAGPGYTAWWLMGNLEGRGGPVGDEWIAQQAQLQKKILKRMRELGMHPVLPGFVGLVPTTLAKKNGVKTIPQGKWPGNHVRPDILDPNDPAFDKMAEAWYEELEKLYGKADCFAGDLFHEGGRAGGINVSKMAAKVQAHMLQHNPKAIWTIQGWGGNPSPRILKNLKKDNTLVVELCGEFWRNWQKTKGFYGHNWAFSTIIMYGGNVGFHGRLQSICDNLNAALNYTHKPVALGATWESIEVNPIVMDYLWDMKWRKSCPPPAQWAKDYAVRRYGFDAPQIRQAWEIIVNTAYGSYPELRRPQESLLCAIPSLNVQKASPYAATCKIHYDQRKLRDALKLLLSASEHCKSKRTYQFDVVDVTRQFVANIGQIFYAEMVDAFKKKDHAKFNKVSAEFLTLIDDQDRLLGCEPMYMLGRWLQQARKVAPTKAQAVQNEKNARWLITTWTPLKSGLNNYAWKEWNGLLKNYYKPRWKLFIDDLNAQLSGAKARRIDYYNEGDKAWGLKTLDEDFYPNTAQGDPVAVATELFAKYSPVLDSRYDAPVTAPKAAKADLIGQWECHSKLPYKCVLHADGKLSLFRDNKKWAGWEGFTWTYDQKKGIALLRRPNGKQFGIMKLTAPGKSEFTGGLKATKLETGKNKEAEEAGEGVINKK